MTGGTAVILGDTGKNFAAGMSGGIAYVLDEKHELYTKVNKSLVSLEEVCHMNDVIKLKRLIENHVKYTGSEKGRKILDNFEEYLKKFKKVLPRDYDKMNRAIISFEEKGLNPDEAKIEAFYQNKA